jgi:hypothetical protein
MPERNDSAKEPSGPWEGWRNAPIVEPAPGWSVEVHPPSFTFTSPEGQKYTVNGPDGATPEQAFAILQGWIGGNQKAEAPPSEEHGPWENYRPASPAGDSRVKVDPRDGLSEFEAAVLEECIAEVNSAEFLSDLLVFEPGKPDPRICTEACWAASGFDRFLHGRH